MYIHLVPDMQFIDDFIQSIKLYGHPEENVYICRMYKNIKYVKSNNVIFSKLTDRKVTKIINKLSSNDKIYVHFLDLEMMKWLAELPRNFKPNISWIYYGGEIYKYFNYKNILLQYMPSTKELINQGVEIPWFLRNPITTYLLKVKRLYHLKNVDQYLLKSLDRINNFTCYNYFEFKYLSSIFNWKLYFEDFFYARIHLLESSNSENTNKHVNSKEIINVQIGHSASPLSNHIDIFNKLPHVKDIYYHCPLSYGKKYYAKKIIKSGYRIFGSNFIPYLTHMEYSEYFKYMKSIDVALFGIMRTGAMSTIRSHIYSGTKVFLHPQNNGYNYLIDLGITLFTLDDISIDSIRTPLTPDEVQNNRRIIDKAFGKERIKQIYNHLF